MFRDALMPYIKQFISADTVNVVNFDNKLEIGRSRENDVIVDDPTVSQKHARIQFDESKHCWVLVDCGSTNGILVAGKRHDDELELSEGQDFNIGTQKFEFSLVEPSALDRTLRIKKSWIPGVYYTE